MGVFEDWQKSTKKSSGNFTPVKTNTVTPSTPSAGGVFGDYQAAISKPKTVSVTPKIKQVSQPEPSLFQKAVSNTKDAVFGVSNVLFGNRENKNYSDVKLPVKQPKEVKLDPVTYKTLSQNIEKEQSKLQKMLTQKKEQLKASKTAPLTYGVRAGGSESSQVVQLRREIKDLELTDKIFRQFLGREKIDSGILPTAAKTIMRNPLETFVPYQADTKSVKEGLEELKAAKKLEKGEKLSPADEVAIQRFIGKTLEGYISKDIGAKAGETLVGMVPYALSFILSGGIYKAGAGATASALEKTATPLIAKRLLSGAVGTIAQGTVGGATQIANKTVEYSLPKPNLVAAEKGDDLLKVVDKGDSFKKALGKAYLSTIVEYASERVGSVVEEALPFLKKGILGRWAEKLGIQSSDALKKLAERVGWNGIILEVFEEEINEIAQAPIEERKYYAPLLTPEGTERLLVETLGITAFGGIANFADVGPNTPPAKAGTETTPPVENVPPKEADTAAKTEQVAQGKTDDTQQIDQVKSKLESYIAPNQGTQNPVSSNTASQQSEDPLIQEARKYKSAEEFVKAQGEILYHGTSAKFDTKDFKGGYLTADKEYADVYQSPSASSISYGEEGVKNKQSGTPRTLEFVLSKDAKVFDYTKPENQALLKDYWGKSSMSYEYSQTKTGQLDWTEGENLRQFFEEKGYKFDAIMLDEAGGIDPESGLEVKRSPSLLVLNPKVLKSREQLTETYNKANTKTVEEKPGSELKAEQKPVGDGKTKESTAYKRVRDRLEQTTREDVNYNQLNLKKDAEAALEFIAKDKKAALRVAFGLEAPPPGQTETAIAIALADKAARDGNYKLQAQLESSRSLRQTRRGQEIVSERGRFDEDSPYHYIQTVLDQRLKNIGKNIKSDIVEQFRKISAAKQNAVERIDKKAREVSKFMRREQSKIKLAQNIIDELTC